MIKLVTMVISIACAAPLHAQDVYVTGGWSQVWRQGPWATLPGPTVSPVQTAAAGVGVWFARDLAVEGSIGFHRDQAVDWEWRYQFAGGANNQRTFDRDVPLTAALRIAPLRGRRVAVEPALTGGISFHRSQSYITADCGPASRPTACVPIDPPKRGETFSTAEWLLGFGADVPLRVSRRLEILPGVHFLFVKRRDYLTGYNHRGPRIGGGRLPGFGVSVRYAIRDP